MSNVERFNSGRVLPAGLPFPEGTALGPLVFLSGQLGNVPGTLGLVPGGIRAEARQALENIATVLHGQGLGLANLVRCTVMLADMDKWARFNTVYASYFAKDRLPARSAFGGARLAFDAPLEVECIATTKRPRR